MLIPFILGLFYHVTTTLRLLDVQVPTAVNIGDPVWLNCTFDLESDQLYSVKWYKNNVEFYCYLPSNDPPAQIYNLLGVYVDLSHCDLGNVLLSRSDLNTGGTYQCEVSTEAPTFETERAERELHVYVLPKEAPKITGTKSQYSIGDKVEINCLAAPSKPPALLQWFVNDMEIPKENLCRRENIKHKNGLEASHMGLHFAVQPSHLWNGVLKFRCTAIISQVYSMSSEEIIVGNTPRARGLYSSADGSIINGGPSKYQLGDMVNVNCSSVKSKKPAALSWFINDKKAQPVSLIRYPMTQHEGGLKSSTLGLKFTVRDHHLQKGKMRLKCTTKLSKVINTSSKETVVQRHQQTSGLHVFETSPGSECYIREFLHKE
ncbi:nephrin-like isoform X2 [Tachypleus tridentatus]|uniref:nephrin-like isoform X2 n=1 Tax=Tachypleus tridentatus TaxID=6853 RepID=UPI003FD395FD